MKLLQVLLLSTTPLLSLCSRAEESKTELQFTDVFVGGRDGYPGYRIPALIPTKRGSLLAFAEGRFLAIHSFQDFNGRVLTIRQDDKRAIAAMLDIPVDQVALRLEALDLVFRPN